MKAPGFWYRRPGLWSTLLYPLAALWAAGAVRRQARSGERVPVPVVCIGNLTAGGTGKTPTVIALVEALSGRAVHVVSRGYGGSEEGPLRVDGRSHSAAQVGDEPLLLSAFAPVWVARDRVAGAQAAVADGAGMVLLDDGYQNPSLIKDLTIVVVDAGVGFGNGRVMPAGPLREPMVTGLARADYVLVIGRPQDRTRFRDRLDFGGPVAEAELAPLQTGMDWAGARVLAFAGIGRPEKFFQTLEDLGADIVAAHGFGDHAPYRADLLARLDREARQLGAQLVTTEKDAARLPDAFRRKVVALPVRLQFADDAGLIDAIKGLS